MWLSAEGLLAALQVIAAGCCLLDRHLLRACGSFIVFAMLMSLAWWQLDAPWLAAAESLLGALLTGAVLLQALGRADDTPRLPRRDTVPSRRDEAPWRWLGSLAWLALTGVAVGGLLGSEALLPRGADRAPLVASGLLVMALGLWAFARHRHLLRRLLAFNLLGSGVFLLLAGLAGPAPEVQGLILVGLVVALIGSVLGVLLLCRLYALEHRLTLEPEPAPEESR